MAVDRRSSFEIIQLLLPDIIERQWGRVVTIGSVQQYRTSPSLMPYGASKAAQEHLTRNFARQLSHTGVTFNNVSPGLIDTDRTSEAVNNPDVIKTWLDRIPARRVGLPIDCVGPVLMLCSNAGAYVTGIDLPVDGGLRLP